MDDTRHIPLIDEAPLHVALEPAPGGGLWEVASTHRVEGTGRDLLMQLWTSGLHRRHVAFSGPTLTGLGDAELEVERQRLAQVRDAAQVALDTVERHLVWRRSLR
jgi:hypothetical protein